MKVYAAWNGESTPRESLTVNRVATTIDTFFTFAYDTSLWGTRTVRFWVRDEDTVMSAARDTAVSVRLGGPVVWGHTPLAANDTVFVNVDRGYSGSAVKYYARVRAADTNGTIQRYYWSNNPWPDSGTVTTGDSLEYTVNILTLHQGLAQYIHVRDDDGLVRGGRFVVFADSAPPAPTFFQNGQSGDSVVLKWGKRMDAKDGMQTRVQIVTCFGDGCMPSDSLYPSANLPTLAQLESKWPVENIGGITCNVVKFKASQSGAGRWRVILVDGRGTRSPAPAVDPATFVAP